MHAASLPSSDYFRYSRPPEDGREEFVGGGKHVRCDFLQACQDLPEVRDGRALAIRFWSLSSTTFLMWAGLALFEEG